jgi:hypothetical protein
MIDKIPRIDDAIAVGEDLKFQRTWWRFEQLAWLILILVLIADALGLLGRGWLARAQRATPDGALHVRYERIERTGTPSQMTIEFGPASIRNGRVHLFASESLVRELGAQRIIPEPLVSQLTPDGITYTFAATDSRATVSFALEPSFPGVHQIELRIPESDGSPSDIVRARVAVLP